jgi:hypothetical protein
MRRTEQLVILVGIDPKREVLVLLRFLLIAAMIGWVMGRLPPGVQLISAGVFLVMAVTIATLEVRRARSR